MKTMKKVLPVVAFALVAVAIVLSFFAAMKITVAGTTGAYKHIIWGCDKIVGEDGSVILIEDMLGVKRISIAVVPFIGLILMLLGGVGALLVALLAKKPGAKWLVLVFGLLILAGAIMQFFALNAFARAFIETSYKEAGIADKEQIEQAIKEAIKNLKQQNARFVVSTIMGILGCVGGASAMVAAVLPEK